MRPGHASYDAQMTFREFFPVPKGGGWYLIEYLDGQPRGEGAGAVARIKFRELQNASTSLSVGPMMIGAMRRSGKTFETRSNLRMKIPRAAPDINIGNKTLFGSTG